MIEAVNKSRILVAPLNWGLGHATRCIPIIKALIDEGFEPILACDGDSLKLLKKEFPKLKNYNLPAYNIRYTNQGWFLRFKLLFNVPRIYRTIKKEKRVVAEIIKKENIQGVISDNRFGVRSDKIPSVYMTHQINILSGISTILTSKIHQNIISKFDICWIPDYEGENSLAGKLSHSNTSKLNLKYINPLSRFDDEISSFEELSKVKKYDILVLLSGPEPQRSLLEEKLLKELESTSKRVLFVRGIVSDKEKEKLRLNNKNVKIVNYMLQDALQKSIIESDIVITRSGYSTIMDLERLNAKAFFIPTPGQNEQKYLAKYLEEKNIAPWSPQNNFRFNYLKKCFDYEGFTQIKLVFYNQFNFEIFK